MAHIKAHHLAVALRGKTIFSDLNFEVNRGQGLVLRGANGVGKTILLQVLSGVLKSKSGVLNLSSEIKKIKFLPYGDRVDEFLKVKDYLSCWGNPKNLDEEIENWNLSELLKVNVARLSAGQFKRVLLASSLSHGADLLLLDEPTVGLDEVHTLKLEQRLKLELERKKVLVMATHEKEHFSTSPWITLEMGGVA
jgi:ABC-type multidrug transport system ATPase subunit